MKTSMKNREARVLAIQAQSGCSRADAEQASRYEFTPTVRGSVDRRVEELLAQGIPLEHATVLAAYRPVPPESAELAKLVDLFQRAGESPAESRRAAMQTLALRRAGASR